ncbi:hypothetical protein BV392_04995 [Rhodovulum sulfidophilum]|nr:hypothetical protein BV392_04995 [Rhodovulum sulfidophilum]
MAAQIALSGGMTSRSSNMAVVRPRPRELTARGPLLAIRVARARAKAAISSAAVLLRKEDLLRGG